MFKVNSEKELLQLLKIVSEEAVTKSRNQLNESTDIAQERYIKSLENSSSVYNVNLSEQEEEADAEKESEKEVSNEEEVEGGETDENEEEPLDPETFGVSFDSVIKDINTLRSGRSTKDKEIKEELLGYYDRLDDDERKILHLFLGELSKILQGALEAEDAVDPSEPPFNARISFGEEGETSAEKESQPQEKTKTRSSGEDSAPPIRVNESQDLAKIRKKVKLLMKRY